MTDTVLLVGGFILGYVTALLVVYSLRHRLYRHHDRFWRW